MTIILRTKYWKESLILEKQAQIENSGKLSSDNLYFIYKLTLPNCNLIFSEKSTTGFLILLLQSSSYIHSFYRHVHLLNHRLPQGVLSVIVL